MNKAKKKQLLLFLSVCCAPSVAILFSLVSGCDTHHQTTPDPDSKNVTDVDLLHDPSFFFRYGDGSGWTGYNVLTVDAHRHCVYIFLDGQRQDAQTWKRATFDCDATTLADLRQLLQDIKATELPKTYQDTSVADGHQRFMDVSLSGYKKQVYWNNYFPVSSEKIDEFINKRILQPQTAPIGRATETTRPSSQ